MKFIIKRLYKGWRRYSISILRLFVLDSGRFDRSAPKARVAELPPILSIFYKEVNRLNDDSVNNVVNRILALDLEMNDQVGICAEIAGDRRSTLKMIASRFPILSGMEASPQYILKEIILWFRNPNRSR